MKSKNKVLKSIKKAIEKQFCDLGVCKIVEGEILCDDKELLRKQLDEKMDLILIKK